jgi:hypothetical protein
MLSDIQSRTAGGGRIEGKAEDGFSLTLPTVPAGTYSLAQLDDYMQLRRGQFPHTTPVTLQLQAKVSAPDLLGTWGFGFWNDPFNAGLGAGGMHRVLPVLPNAAWFFYGSAPNHLTLREDLPGDGFHAKVFRSPLLPSFASLLGLPALPLMLWPPTARVLRRLARTLVQEDAEPLAHDVTNWHTYCIELRYDRVHFKVDGEIVFSTPALPRGRMGLVIWIDNQYFEFNPQGKLGFGFLGTPASQVMDIQRLTLSRTLRYD